MSVPLPEMFDAESIPKDDGREPIAPGIYEAVLSETSSEPNATGGGQRMKFVFQITSERSHGRKIHHSINFGHSNATADKIARRTLADICLAVGVPKIRSTGDLHNIPLLIQIAPERNKQTGEEFMRIKEFKPTPSRVNTPPIGRAARAPEMIPAANVNPDAEDTNPSANGSDQGSTEFFGFV